MSWCYRFEWAWEAELCPKDGGEAVEVGWFPISHLPDDLWPGTAELVQKVVSTRHAAETYASISAQAETHNALMWQTPALAMTAQAFLLTIALSADVSAGSQLAAAGLSFVVSVLSIQLMLKHSAMQLRDQEALKELERIRGMAIIHVKPSFPGRGLRAILLNQSSRHWWIAGMSMFGVVSLALVVIALMEMTY